MNGPELYAMLCEELESEAITAKEWEALHDRAKIAWNMLARRLTREMRPAQAMLSSQYPD